MKKNFLNMLLLAMALVVGACVVQREASPSPRSQDRYEPEPPSADFQLFYDDLSPYGTWVDYPKYGYVWMPDVEADFEPYASDGRWVFTEDGWTWVSDYRWGWAAFHYGRWDYDPMYGWFWVPDNEWAPAWVVWRRGPGYYGWAPLPPGVSMTMALGRNFHPHHDRWIFVRDVDLIDPDIRYRYIDRRRYPVIINNTTIIVNTHRDNRRNATYIAGPPRDEIERTTRTRLDPVVIREDSRPGHRLRGNELDIYRPEIRTQGRAGGQRPAPPRVRRLDEIRPPAERDRGGMRQRDAAPPPTANPPGAGQQQQQPPPTRQRDATPPPVVTPPATTPPATTPTPRDNTRRRDQQPRSPGRQREALPSERGQRDQQQQPPTPNANPTDEQKQKELKKAPPRKRTRTEQEKPEDARKKEEERERRKREER